MRSQPKLLEEYRWPGRKQEAAAPVDREARSPGLRWLMHLGLPMGISLALHLSLVGILVWKTWTVLSAEAGGRFEATITNASSDLMGGGFKWPGQTALQPPEPQELSPVELLPSADLSALSEAALRDMHALDQASTAGGLGLAERGLSAILGTGGGVTGGGSGELGSSLGTGGGIGTAGVWDLRVPGNKFAYVIDYSGSIIVAVDDLKRELKRSVGQLTPQQEFDVFLFFSRGNEQRERFITESFAPGLQAAAPEVKSSFFRWLDQKAPMGSTEPLMAMKRALALRPDTIFFFSDGYFDDRVVDEIAKANRGAKVTIHCLVFDEILLQHVAALPPRMTDGARRLQRIAAQNGGRLKLVTGADLRGR